MLRLLVRAALAIGGFLATYLAWNVLDAIRGIGHLGTAPANPGPGLGPPVNSWIDMTVAAPLWVFVVAVVIGAMSTFLPTIYRSERLDDILWAIRRARDHPKTFRQKVFQIAREVNAMANWRGANPSGDDDWLITQRYGKRLIKDVHAIKNRAEKLYGHDAVRDLVQTLPIGVKKLRRISELLDRLALTIAEDIPAQPLVDSGD